MPELDAAIVARPTASIFPARDASSEQPAPAGIERG